MKESDEKTNTNGNIAWELHLDVLRWRHHTPREFLLCVTVADNGGVIRLVLVSPDRLKTFHGLNVCFLLVLSICMSIAQQRVRVISTAWCTLKTPG